MTDFHFDQNSLSAFATILAGFMAVGGAVFVGWQQAKILHEQNEIARRQIEISVQSLRANLFDRRYKIYCDVNNFLVTIIHTKNQPEQAIENAFLTSLNQSRLLFRPVVYNNLKEILELTNSYFSDCETMKKNNKDLDGGFHEAHWRKLEKINRYIDERPVIFDEQLQFPD